MLSSPVTHSSGSLRADPSCCAFSSCFLFDTTSSFIATPSIASGGAAHAGWRAGCVPNKNRKGIGSVRSLITSGPRWRKADSPLRPLEQFLRIVNRPRLHHHPHLTRVPDVTERISVDHEQVGELSRLEGAELVGYAKRASAIDRRDPERRGGRYTGEHQRVQLAMRREAGDELAGARVVGA